MEGEDHSNSGSPTRCPEVRTSRFHSRRRSIQERMWLPEAADAARLIPKRSQHKGIDVPLTSPSQAVVHFQNNRACCDQALISTSGPFDATAPVPDCSTAGPVTPAVATAVAIAETGTCKVATVAAHQCLDCPCISDKPPAQSKSCVCTEGFCGQSMQHSITGTSVVASACAAWEQPPSQMALLKDHRSQAITSNCTEQQRTGGAAELDISEVQGNKFAVDGAIISSPPLQLVDEGISRHSSLNCMQQTLPTVGHNSIVKPCHASQPGDVSARMYDRTSQPSYATLASKPSITCAVDIAGQTGSRNCPAPCLSADDLFIYDIFRSDDAYVPQPGQAGHTSHLADTSSCRLSLRHHNPNAAMDAVPLYAHSRSDDSVAEGGPITPPARRSHEVSCVGSAPAAVWRHLEPPMLDPREGGYSIQNILSSAGVDDHQNSEAAPRAMSVDSYQEAVRNISALDHTAQDVQGVPAGSSYIEWQQDALLVPSSLRNMATTFQSRLEHSYRDPMDGLASGVVLPGFNCSAGLSCPPADPILPVAASQNYYWHAAEAAMDRPCGVHDIARVGHGPYFEAVVLRSGSIPSDQRFADPDSSDEAPLEPPPPVCEAVSSPGIPVAKQLRRVAQVQQGAAACAQTPQDLVVHHVQHASVTQISEFSTLADTEATVCTYAQNPSVVDRIRPGLPEMFSADCVGHDRQQPASSLADKAVRMQVPSAEPVSCQPSSPAVCNNPQVGAMRSRAAVASLSQDSEDVAPTGHRQTKRGRSSAPDKAEHMHMFEGWGLGRFHEPCSEHVEGWFPGHAVCDWYLATVLLHLIYVQKTGLSVTLSVFIRMPVIPVL